MTKRSVRSALTVAIAAVVSLLFLVPVSASTAYAKEDDVHALEKKLEKAAKAYSEAKKDLKDIEKRKKTLKKDIREGEKRIEDLSEEINDFAQAAYLSGGLPTASAMLAAGSPEEAVRSMATMTYLGENSADELEDFITAAEDLEADRDALKDETAKAKKAVKKKKKAVDKLKGQIEEIEGGPGSGPGGAAGNGPGGGGSCSESDPTGTGGCVTPTMKHAYQQAQAAGYTRYTKCYRSQDSGEHGKGRACDFAASASGFGSDATGGDQTYGDNLAGWFKDNASALGVYYIIWDNKIWFEGTGWGDYSSGHTGNPSQDHTDHVHLSVD